MIKNKIKQLTNPIEKELNEVNTLISAILNKEQVESVLEINKHIDNKKGKRLRPILLLLSFFMTENDKKNDIKNVIKIGSAIEFIHMASLVHDDIIDNAETRHNQITINKKWSNEVGIAHGIYLYSTALKLISETKNINCLKEISESVQKLSLGELDQILTRNKNISIDQYYTIIENKTATLFETCLKCGGHLNSINEKELNILQNIGYSLGILFQISDDYLDIFDSTNELKKGKGQDILKGELTLPIILLLKKYNKKDQENFLKKIKDQNNSIFNEIKNEINIHNISEEINEIIKVQYHNIIKNLDYFKPSKYKSSITEIANYIYNRSQK
tara:strand:- start:61 stop:1053 length:993 start_codon:yes stop_codon:yes gene_type:complete